MLSGLQAGWASSGGWGKRVSGETSPQKVEGSSPRFWSWCFQEKYLHLFPSLSKRKQYFLLETRERHFIVAMWHARTSKSILPAKTFWQALFSVELRSCFSAQKKRARSFWEKSFYLFIFWYWGLDSGPSHGATSPALLRLFILKLGLAKFLRLVVNLWPSRLSLPECCNYRGATTPG